MGPHGILCPLGVPRRNGLQDLTMMPIRPGTHFWIRSGPPPRICEGPLKRTHHRHEEGILGGSQDLVMKFNIRPVHTLKITCCSGFGKALEACFERFNIFSRAVIGCMAT